jgi:undecaprenyl-diphosphatase
MEFLHALPLLVKAAILGIVEGVTEFLPVSSTGHLIVVGSLLGWHDDKAKVFEIAIQTGAMFSVIWYFRERIMRVVAGLTGDPTAQRFAVNVIVASIPAVLLGLLFGSYIKAVLFNPVPVAIALVLGGFVILWVERHHRQLTAAGRVPPIQDIDSITPRDALKVGLAQAVALIPGTSRSGATIIGAMLFGLSRRAATEFSFFLAIPLLIGAGLYDSWKYRAILGADDVPLFAVGLVTAFFSALAGVHWLIRFIATHDFTFFAWYRIAFGGLVLATAWSGLVVWPG